jgi:hypothetical protein
MDSSSFLGTLCICMRLCIHNLNFQRSYTYFKKATVIMIHQVSAVQGDFESCADILTSGRTPQ